MPPFAAAFYDRPVLAVAPDLLGATVRHGPVAVRITEVEAYGGRDDPASHAYGGPTPRAAVMFGPPGCAYVYLSYGVHWCLNVVCGPVGEGSAVLIRAGEVTAGREAVRDRWPSLALRDLARGPGRLGRALGVGPTLTGTPVTGGGPLSVGPARPPLPLDRRPTASDDAVLVPTSSSRGTSSPGPPSPRRDQLTRVRSGPRVGIRTAVDRPWRFWLAGDETVSGARQSRATRGSGPAGLLRG
ncbi:DNA-3-methyladenine glycosylase [Frankia sp. AgB32]|uniref:DNA-3-methyladenine glycosylase n=1 Tax=Frankia sp. AgB32 TaxID=631119 RepID=UPI00200FE104|nr:DNA-3-methyladenine glycosylase [Frankia sp. AgB32]MCK9898261.1 DNA-3-methyladenine glycosylase [Frankia sp. AgB32]